MFLDSKATLDIEGQSNTLIEINFQLRTFLPCYQFELMGKVT